MRGDKREALEKILLEPDDEPLCSCKTCACEKHKCPTRIVRCKYPSQSKSLYQQDFVKPDRSGATEYYNVNKIVAKKPDFPFEKKSAYKVFSVILIILRIERI